MRWLFWSQILHLFELLAIVWHHFLFLFLRWVWLSILLFFVVRSNFISLAWLSLCTFLFKAPFLHHRIVDSCRGALQLRVTWSWVAYGITFIWFLIDGSQRLTIGMYHDFICLSRKRFDLPRSNFLFFYERHSIDGEVFFCRDNTAILWADFDVERLRVVDARHWSIGTWLWSLLRYLNTDRLDLFFVILA